MHLPIVFPSNVNYLDKTDHDNIIPPLRSYDTRHPQDLPPSATFVLDLHYTRSNVTSHVL